MRKLIAAFFAFCLTVGLAVAADVTFVKWDPTTKMLTVSDAGVEKSYKVGDKVKTENFGKLKEGKSKLDVTIDGDTITMVKGKKKKTQ